MLHTVQQLIYVNNRAYTKIKMESSSRNKNFSSDEINLLLSLVQKNADVLECKATGKVRPDQKEKVWENVAESFNASCSGAPRSLKTLRTKYSNLKSDMKKRSAEHKKYWYGTGGGPPREQTVSEIDQLLIGILPEKQVQGMKPNYDSDKINNKDLNQSGLSAVETDGQSQHVPFKEAMNSPTMEEKNDNGTNDMDICEQSTSKRVRTSSPKHSGEEDNFELWENYSSVQLKTPKNKKLCVESVNRKQTSWAKLAEIKSKWSERKLREEMELAKIEHTLRVSQMKETHQLQKQFATEKHALEIRILEEQLKKASNT